LNRYSLLTRWHLEAPIALVWGALVVPEEWPRWWRYVQAVVEVEKGDAQGIGACRRYTWTSRLPYRLSFDMRTTRVQRPTLLEGVASGDLNGTGRWQLAERDGATFVQYEWRVSTAKAWMNVLGPLLAPLFAWNHDQVMREGARGLARHLGVRLRAFCGSGAADEPAARDLHHDGGR
jgi:uncharacterized protein YndB with AHSA1/START domain